MRLQILNEAKPHNVQVLRLAGRLTEGENARMLRDALESLATNSPSTAVVLDLAGVDYVDSTGMGTLVSSFINAQKVGQRIVLSGLTRRLRELLELSKLRTIFDVYENTEEAVQSVAVR